MRPIVPAVLLTACGAAAAQPAFDIQFTSLDIAYADGILRDANGGGWDPLTSVVFLVDGAPITVQVSEIEADFGVPRGGAILSDGLSPLGEGQLYMNFAGGGTMHVALSDLLVFSRDNGAMQYAIQLTGEARVLSFSGLPEGFDIAPGSAATFSLTSTRVTDVSLDGAHYGGFNANTTGTLTVLPTPGSAVLCGLAGLLAAARRR